MIFMIDPKLTNLPKIFAFCYHFLMNITLLKFVPIWYKLLKILKNGPIHTKIYKEKWIIDIPVRLILLPMSVAHPYPLLY